MRRGATLIALLGGVIAVLLVIAVSGCGGDDEKAGTSALAPTSSEKSTGNGASTQSKEDRKGSQDTRSKRRSRPQEEGRLGPQPGGSPAQGERTGHSRRGAKVATIELSGGAPIGGVQSVSFQRNKRVRLIVRSNTDEVIEIVGYGLTRRVRAGGSARFYFETKKKGLFSIELERGQTRIGVLAVG